MAQMALPFLVPKVAKSAIGKRATRGVKRFETENQMKQS
jgi:hypothetical protein